MTIDVLKKETIYDENTYGNFTETFAKFAQNDDYIFGDRLFYISKMDGHKTPCVFLRDGYNATKKCRIAKIMFQNAVRPAEVDFSSLERL